MTLFSSCYLSFNKKINELQRHEINDIKKSPLRGSGFLG